MTDDADTEPVIVQDNARSEFRSVLVDPGAEVEVVVGPEQPMQDPLLFLSTNPRDAKAIVAKIVLGGVELVSERSPISEYKFGHPTRGEVSSERPIKIFLSNESSEQVRIGASLVVGEENPTKE